MEDVMVHSYTDLQVATLSSLRSAGFCLLESEDIGGDHQDPYDTMRRAASLFNGEALPQDSLGATVTTIVDKGGACPMHTDGGDVTILVCSEQAQKGGATLLVDTRPIHRDLACSKPKILSILYEDWPFSRRGRPGPSYFSHPIFRIIGEEVVSFWLPNSIMLAFDGLENVLDEEHMKAFQVFDECCQSARYVHSVIMQPGEVLLLNNRCMVHGRTPFNHGANRRTLLRQWLKTDDLGLSMWGKQNQNSPAALPPISL